MVAVQICTPTGCAGGSLLSASSPAFAGFCLFDKSHSNWSEMIAHCGLDGSDTEHCFHISAGYLCSSEKGLFRSFAHFLNGFFVIVAEFVFIF